MTVQPIRTLDEAQAALRPFYANLHTAKYNLDNMRRLMAQLGNPQNRLKVVHVAGTSGKTSTAYYVSALLGAAGFTTGLTVSPHVDGVNERVQIGTMPLPPAEFGAALSEFLALVEPSGLKLSYFELLVGLAYWQFARRGVDYAVVEVGLGGLLDGTNVIERPDKVCVITDIGLDHTEILGDTLEQIAAQKAGIIQEHNQVFMYQQGQEVMQQIQARCAKQQASLQTLTARDQQPIKSLPLFQRRNLGLAIRAVNFVLQRDGRQALTPAQINRAAATRIPARLERFELVGKTVIVDGSHNAQKLAALADSVRALYPQQPVAALVGFVEGRDSRWQGGIDQVMGLAKRLIVTAFHSELDVPKSSVDPRQVANYCRAKGFEAVAVVADPAEALASLKRAPEPLLLVCGSFYLLNHIRPLIVKAND